MNGTNNANCFQNRELSWLDFNGRVLDQSSREDTPVLERLKFVSIFTTNLDEFFMVRVGSLFDQMKFAPKIRENKTGMTAEEQLNRIFEKTKPLYDLRRDRFMEINQDLSGYGIKHDLVCETNETVRNGLEEFFKNSILPLLSPQIVDNRNPFPHMANKHLYVAVSLERKKKQMFGIIGVPQNVERIIFYEDFPLRYVLLEELICHYADIVFNMYNVLEKTIISITRNADINTEEGFLDEDIDYRHHVQKIIRLRNRLSPVRLELTEKVSGPFLDYFLEKLSIHKKQSFFTDSPIDFTYCSALTDKIGDPLKSQLTWPGFVPYDGKFADKKMNILKAVQKNDMLLHYPYESMNPFLTLIKQAAEDTNVLSIKITLYRLNKKSRLAELLINAAENGKEVVAVMELRARFDEDNNIEWAQRLEESGCRVIYGPPGCKVHSKICLITRREFGKILYTTQIGTGNYNEVTAKMYTDLSLISADPLLGRDANQFFTNLMLGNVRSEFDRLVTAPYYFKANILSRIETEAAKAKKGDAGRIIIKCNSLTDKEIIESLIEASQAGVRISLIIRGICCLVPKVFGFTDNIEVISIVGKFLEHSRIFCFGTGMKAEALISSADLMTRNTERRVEIACPVTDADIKQRIFEMLEIMLADNVKAWDLTLEGSYLPRKTPESPSVNSQEIFVSKAMEIESNYDNAPGTDKSLRPLHRLYTKLTR